MNQEYEEVIDLRVVGYKALKKWRVAIHIGVVVAILLALFSVAGKLTTVLDKEKYEKAYSQYEKTLAGYEAQGTLFEKTVENYETYRDRQKEYNENSLLMKIDAKNKAVGSLRYYVNVELNLDSSVMYSSLSFFTQPVMSAYSSAFSNELYEYILAHSSIASEQKYLREVLHYGVDVASTSFTFTVYGKDTQQVNELIKLVQQFVSSKYDAINSTVGKHTTAVMENTCYTIVDDALADTQKSNQQLLVEYDKSIDETLKEQEKWAKDAKNAEPQFEFSTWEIVKDAIKKLIIGGIVGVLLGFVWFAVTAIITHKFSEENLVSCAGGETPVLGKLYPAETRKKKAFHGIDEWLRNLFGYISVEESFEDSCRMTAANIAQSCKAKGIDKVGIVGSLSEEAGKKMEAGLQSAISGIQVSYLGNILANPSAVSSLSEYSDIITVDQEKADSKTFVTRQHEVLRTWGKEVLGDIICKAERYN